MSISSLPKMIVAVIVSLGIFAGGQTAQAGGYSDVDLQALELQRRSRDLLHEFRVHYRRTCQYRQLLADTLEMYDLASHIHEVACNRGSLAHIRNDLRELGSLHHHIEDLVAVIERDPSGRVLGQTCHVHRRLREMDANIHAMEDLVSHLLHAETRTIRTTRSYSDPYDSHRHYDSYRGRPVYTPSRPTYVPSHTRTIHRVYTPSRSGIRIGDDNFSIRIGW